MLWQKDLPGANVVIRGARVLDPVEGADARLEVRIDDGTIVEVAEKVDTNEHRVVEADGLVLAPAFVDPHVHLRTPGREDEETVASGTAAAAAGGYCAILAMPNTDPVVDSAATLGALVESAGRDAAVPTGFLAAITRGQRGEELTEMGELADLGAVAFSDDGVPVASAGLMRRALQYASTTERPLALHCEEPAVTCTRDASPQSSASRATPPSRSRSQSSATSRSRATREGASTCCTSRQRSRSARCAGRGRRESLRAVRRRRTTSSSQTTRCARSTRT
jgi:dihydroorotase